MYGRGSIYAPNGNSDAADVIRLNGDLGSSGFVAIKTFHDVWLPYRLDGEPQQAICELNAPRLERVLRRMDRELGLNLLGLDGKLADIHGYRVTNKRYDDGDVFIPSFVEVTDP